MADALTIKSLPLIISACLFTVSATVAIETRYARAQAVQETARSALIASQIEGERAKYYAIVLWVADLTSRAMMYQARSEGGVLTEADRNRWNQIREELAAKVRESERLQQRIDDFEKSLVPN